MDLLRRGRLVLRRPIGRPLRGYLRGNALLVTIALLGALLVSCSQSSDGQEAAWTVPNEGGTGQLSTGVELSVPAGALPGGTKVTSKPGSPAALKAAGDWRSSPAGSKGPSVVTEVVAIDAGSATLAKPGTLRLKVKDEPIEPDLAFVATFDEKRSVWVPVGGDFNPTARTLTVTIDHLSIWAGFAWAVDAVKQTVLDVAREVFGPRIVPLPAISCPASTVVSLEVSGVKQLDTCLTSGAGGAVSLKVRNSRAYALALLSQAGSAKLDETLGLSQVVRGLLGKVVDTPGTIYLPSGATATISLNLPPGASAQVVTDVDMNAYLLDAIYLSVEVYLATYTTLLGKATVEDEAFSAALGSSVDLPRCAEHALGLARVGDALSRDAMNKWGKAAFDCVGTALEAMSKSAATEVVEKLAGLLSIAGLVIGIIRTVIASGEILGDIFTNTVAYLPAYTLLTLKAQPTPSPPVPSEPGPAKPNPDQRDGNPNPSPPGGNGDANKTVTTPPPVRPQQVKISSKMGWQSTPWEIVPGPSFGIHQVSGRWSTDHVNVPYVGIEGYSPDADARIYQGCKLDPNLPYGVMLARIDNGPAFVVGPGHPFTPSAGGPVPADSRYRPMPGRQRWVPRSGVGLGYLTLDRAVNTVGALSDSTASPSLAQGPEESVVLATIPNGAHQGVRRCRTNGRLLAGSKNSRCPIAASVPPVVGHVAPDGPSHTIGAGRG